MSDSFDIGILTSAFIWDNNFEKSYGFSTTLEPNEYEGPMPNPSPIGILFPSLLWAYQFVTGNLGVNPIEKLMDELGLTYSDLVKKGVRNLWNQRKQEKALTL